MRYRTLGTTGLQVSELSIGTAMLGTNGGRSREDSVRVVHRGLDAGINLVDTADVYSNGEAEEIVGAALHGRRDEVVLSTKFGSRMGSDPNSGGGSRRWIVRAVEASLRRLRTDWIDLYQLHRVDPTCDIAETLEALTDLAQRGKIRYFGGSTTPATGIVEAQWTAERHRTGRFVSEQVPYSLLTREAELEILPACRRHGLGVLVWAPLAGGWLSGAYRLDREPPRHPRQSEAPFAPHYDLSLPGNQAKLRAAHELAELAAAHDLTLVQLALAFVLRHPATTSVLTGPETKEHVDGSLAAVETVLDDDLLDAIDTIVPPGEMLNPYDRGYSYPSLEPESRRRHV